MGRASRPALAAWVPLALACAGARGQVLPDLPEALIGITWDRDVLPGPPSTPSGWPDSASALTYGADYRNAVHGPGGLPALGQAGQALAWRGTLAPGLRAGLGAEARSRDFALGAGGFRADASGRGLAGAGFLEFPFAAALVPRAEAAWDGDHPRRPSLLALGFRGAGPAGSAWSLGWRGLDAAYPARLRPDSNSEVTVPFLLRQDRASAGLRLPLGAFAASWDGWLAGDRYRDLVTSGYALGDSGWSGRQDFALDWGRPWRGGALAARAGAGVLAGRHILAGYGPRAGTAAPFSYQRARQGGLDGRLDLGWNGPSARYRAWADAGRWRLEAYRPTIPYGHYTWDRNLILPAYQGGILSVLEDETWLFDGDLALKRAMAGAGLGGTRALAALGAGADWGWDFDLGGGYLSLDGGYRLRRRETRYLLGYSQTTSATLLPFRELYLVAPALGLSAHLGRLGLWARGSQALPVRYREYGGGNSSATQASGGWRGGTSARAGMEWRLGP